ncbi:hypothetical protein [Thiomicrorhabdus sp.]|uniref:hypothetical protein n=1 Tax=Thiomicrorhabdus sp. TaxID=2039724 RepID=UPI0029C7B71D|nr:hypothetical protein [Thiomicrorhabdus sp.]
MPDLNSIGSALLITLALLAAAVVIVGLSMWWLYRFFRDKDASCSRTREDHREAKD